jgi:hypothetical protein
MQHNIRLSEFSATRSGKRSLASSRCCFSMSSIRTPPLPPSPRSQLSSTTFQPNRSSSPPLARRSDLPHLGLGLTYPPSCACILIHYITNTCSRSESSSSIVAVPLKPAAVARIREPPEQAEDTIISRARVHVANSLNP